MSQVVIHCPETDKDIPTGIDLDKTAWESMQLEQGTTQCLWCGELHVWSKQEARLEDLSALAEEAEQTEQTEEELPEQAEELALQA